MGLLDDSGVGMETTSSPQATFFEVEENCNESIELFPKPSKRVKFLDLPHSQEHSPVSLSEDPSGNSTDPRNYVIKRFLIDLLGKSAYMNYMEIDETHKVQKIEFIESTTRILSHQVNIFFTHIEFIREQVVDLFSANLDDGCTLLHFAAEFSSSAALVKLLIDQGASLNARDKYNRTPLHLAAKHPFSIAAVKVLVNHRADIEARDKYKRTPLHLAAEHSTLEVVKFLVSNGANINSVYYDSSFKPRSVLFNAISSSSMGKVRFFFDEGVDLSHPMYEVYPLLNFAARYSSLAIFKFLLNRGLDFQADDQSGESLVHCAAMNEDLASATGIIQILLDSDVNIFALDKNGSSALHAALERPMLFTCGSVIGVSMFLIELGAGVNLPGANINLPDPKSKLTPLLLAAKKALPSDFYRFLLDKGADINAVDEKGCTALHYAAEFKSSPLTLELFIDAGLDVNVQDDSGSTPLFYAVLQPSEVPVKVLLDRGADVNVVNKEGLTPLLTAITKTPIGDSVNILRLLIENGADVDAQDSDGSTALHHAASRLPATNRASRLLLNHGADTKIENSAGKTALQLVPESQLYKVSRFFRLKSKGLEWTGRYWSGAGTKNIKSI